MVGYFGNFDGDEEVEWDEILLQATIGWQQGWDSDCLGAGTLGHSTAVPVSATSMQPQHHKSRFLRSRVLSLAEMCWLGSCIAILCAAICVRLSIS